MINLLRMAVVLRVLRVVLCLRLGVVRVRAGFVHGVQLRRVGRRGFRRRWACFAAVIIPSEVEHRAAASAAAVAEPRSQRAAPSA